MSSSKYLNTIKDIFAGFKTAKNFQRIAGICRVVDATENKLKVEFEVQEEHTNPFKTLHGGCTSTLIDIVTTQAIMAKSGKLGVTVDLNVSYLAPARIGEIIILEASVTKLGKNLCFTRADLYKKNDNTIVATGLHTKAFLKSEN